MLLNLNPLKKEYEAQRNETNVLLVVLRLGEGDELRRRVMDGGMMADMTCLSVKCSHCSIINRRSSGSSITLVVHSRHQHEHHHRRHHHCCIAKQVIKLEWGVLCQLPVHSYGNSWEGGGLPRHNHQRCQNSRYTLWGKQFGKCRAYVHSVMVESNA